MLLVNNLSLCKKVDHVIVNGYYLDFYTRKRIPNKRRKKKIEKKMKAIADRKHKNIAEALYTESPTLKMLKGNKGMSNGRYSWWGKR